jgi:hypothetical protein
MQKFDGLFPPHPPFSPLRILLVEMRDFMRCCSSAIPSPMEQANCYTDLSRVEQKANSLTIPDFFLNFRARIA